MTKRKSRQYRSTTCLNCATPLDISEQYCHHCGQLNSTKKLSISDFFEEFLSNFYAYDSRLRNSIVSIFTKPGILAKEFNAGKRQKYANPFRLFLSVSILLFITFSIKMKISDDYNSVKEISNSLNENGAAQQLNQINDTITITSSLLENEISLFGDFNRDSIYSKKEIRKNSFSALYIISSFKNYSVQHPEKTEQEALQNLGYENNRLNRFVYNKSKEFKSNHILEELADYFYQKLPFLIFLSLPIITFIFCIVYYTKKVNYTEHLIFCYSFFSFIFICMILFNITEMLSKSFANFLIFSSFLFLFPIYFYKSLRNFYEEKRWKTVLKFIILIPLFGLFLFISMLIMISLGIILF